MRADLAMVNNARLSLVDKFDRVLDCDYVSLAAGVGMVDDRGQGG